MREFLLVFHIPYISTALVLLGFGIDIGLIVAAMALNMGTLLRATK